MAIVKGPVRGKMIDESAKAQPSQVTQPERLEEHEPPYTTLGFLTSPKFGAAGSGGLEYELLPEAHDR